MGARNPQTHRGSTMRGLRQCPKCGNMFTVNKYGEIRPHGPRYSRCSGSGTTGRLSAPHDPQVWMERALNRGLDRLNAIIEDLGESKAIHPLTGELRALRRELHTVAFHAGIKTGDEHGK
jgi:hypothetical protein